MESIPTQNVNWQRVSDLVKTLANRKSGKNSILMPGAEQSTTITNLQGTGHSRPFHQGTFDDHLSLGILGATVLSSGIQLWWFGRVCLNQIDYDGMAYTGIARHLRQGQFHAAINAFRSPLLSWLIAAVPFNSDDYLRIGKYINIGSFLLSAILLYVLTRNLWHSKRAASLATLLFVLGRGLVVAAVGMVTPDFLFAALTLFYFIILLRSLQTDNVKDWFTLGTVHGVAFLAKGFALPWLALSTVAALFLSRKTWKLTAVRFGMAAAIPVFVAIAWAAVLHSKYDVFTTGTQLKANFLQWTLRETSKHTDKTYAILNNTANKVDDYLVDDPMPPGSWPWSYHVSIARAVPDILAAELRNVPRVLKELMIVITLGGLAAFVVITATTISHNNSQYRVKRGFVAVIALSAVSLIAAYSMLVFDVRYLFPLVPLILAVAVRLLVREGDLYHGYLRKICIAFVCVGIVASLVYKSSPFRTLTSDSQVSCYDAARQLREHKSTTIVSIGSGPFPEHGVGWEAGYKVAYFARVRLLGTTDSLPGPSQLNTLMADVRKASPDAILVWGRNDDADYRVLINQFALAYPGSVQQLIVDPSLGGVGMAIFVVS